MILLFTDFGSHDIYVGQMKVALLRHCGSVPVVDLLHEAPAHDIALSAHLLAALSASLPDGDKVVLAVVDPGVGGARRPVVMQADGIWYVGPDNGLLSVVAQRSKVVRVWEIVWRPPAMSASFHGRDLFAPIAAMLATGSWWDHALQEVAALDVKLPPGSLQQIIYVDHYGNAMTGMLAGELRQDALLSVNQVEIAHARVFSEVEARGLFWYENSIGLVEVAANLANAAHILGVMPGAEVRVTRGASRSTAP